LLNSNTSSTSPHNMISFGPAEIVRRVWGAPANFNEFRILASLLHRRRSMEVNQTLHEVWPSPALVHCIYIFGGSLPPDGILPDAKFTLRPSLARHLYLAGRLSRWASAHVLVMAALRNRAGHYIFALWFLYSICLSIFPHLISAAADWMSTILLHVVWRGPHGVALVRI